jgi:hypothetical protein
VYLAGYYCGEAGTPYGVPVDLAFACLELAAWKDGEHLESSLPENIRPLLEANKRRTI